MTLLEDVQLDHHELNDRNKLLSIEQAIILADIYYLQITVPYSNQLVNEEIECYLDYLIYNYNMDHNNNVTSINWNWSILYHALRIRSILQKMKHNYQDRTLQQLEDLITHVYMMPLKQLKQQQQEEEEEVDIHQKSIKRSR